MGPAGENEKGRETGGGRWAAIKIAFGRQTRFAKAPMPALVLERGTFHNTGLEPVLDREVHAGRVPQFCSVTYRNIAPPFALSHKRQTCSSPYNSLTSKCPESMVDAYCTNSVCGGH